MRAVKIFIGASATLCSANQLTKRDPYDSLFNDFKKRYKRSYASSTEEQHRRQIFKDNMKRAEELNGLDQNYIPYGHLSPFADWSKDEFEVKNQFKKQMSGKEQLKQLEDKFQHKKMRKFGKKIGGKNDKDINSKEDSEEELTNEPVFESNISPQFGKGPLSSIQYAPDSYDWRSKGGVNPVKNQGQCGSCWSFATVANIEGAAFAENIKVGGRVYNLSEQQLVDCDKSDNGCDGGLPEQADKWLIAHETGLENEQEYPYEGEVGVCRERQEREKIFVEKFVHISQDESTIAAALMQYGPLSIGINANTMQLYMGGIAEPSVEACNPQMLNHGVTLVGFGTETNSPKHPLGLKEMMRMHYEYKSMGLIERMPEFSEEDKRGGGEKPFWIIRNSWGAEWGEEGYYRIIRGKGACGMNTMVTSASKITSVKPEPIMAIGSSEPAKSSSDAAKIVDLPTTEAEKPSQKVEMYI